MDFGFTTAALMEENSCQPAFSCPSLNHVFGNAFRPGHVVEITGKAGSGKTQVILNLCAGGATSKDDRSRCVVLFTEGLFPTERLRDMTGASGNANDHAMDHVLVESVMDTDSLFESIQYKVPKLAETFNLTMVVVDSVTAPLRGETQERKLRANSIHRLGHLLNSLARKLKVPVVITNQVTASMNRHLESYGRNVVPCLGLSLSYYVLTRIFLARTDLVVTKAAADDDKEVKADTRLRTATVDFSPLLPSGKPHHFVVDKTGPRAVHIKENPG